VWAVNIRGVLFAVRADKLVAGFPEHTEGNVYTAGSSATYFCTHCDLRIQLIVTCTHSCLSVYRPTMEWTVELYKKKSVLWGPNHLKYYNKLHKVNAWEDSL